MSARRATSLCVPVDARSAVEALAYRNRAPLLAIRAGRPALLVTLTVPDQIEVGHVEFAWQLATSATAYAVEVDRRYLGLPPGPSTTGGGGVIPSSAYVRFSSDGPVEVDASLHLTGNSFIHCCTYDGEPPILSIKRPRGLV
jgi:hypothetical protein